MRGLEFPTTPDLLILPSPDLNFYAREIEGCLCVNPGALIKNNMGGTYASITLDPIGATGEGENLSNKGKERIRVDIHNI